MNLTAQVFSFMLSLLDQCSWQRVTLFLKRVGGTLASESVWTLYVLAVQPLVRYLTSLLLSHNSSFVKWEWKFIHCRVGMKIVTNSGKFF